MTMLVAPEATVYVLVCTPQRKPCMAEIKHRFQCFTVHFFIFLNDKLQHNARQTQQ